MTKRFSSFLRPFIVVLHPNYEALTHFMATLPKRFQNDEGRMIYEGRNQLREFQMDGKTFIAKYFPHPNILNRLVYGTLRKSKARRSYEYALLLRSIGIDSPAPVGYYTERWLGLLFGRSYYVCLRSSLPYSYNDIINHSLPPQEEDDSLRAIARTAARLHEAGMVHNDFSQGNILFGRGNDGHIRVELIDLNRIRFHKVSIEEGCRNFADRLPTTDRQRRIVAEEYAKARQCEASKCLNLLTKAYEDKA